MIRFGSVLALLLLLSAQAQTECTTDDRAALTRFGYSPEQIDLLCALREDDFPPPAAGGAATYCNTPESFCPLSTPAQAGTDCICSSPGGPLRGVAE